MSNCLTDDLVTLRDDGKEIVIVTAKQYLAVAESVLRVLFPEVPSSSFSDNDEETNFAVYIADDECDAYLERRIHSC
jgi:hypothetical protein